MLHSKDPYAVKISHGGKFYTVRIPKKQIPWPLVGGYLCSNLHASFLQEVNIVPFSDCWLQIRILSQVKLKVHKILSVVAMRYASYATMSMNIAVNNAYIFRWALNQWHSFPTVEICLFILAYKCTLQILNFELDVSKHISRNDPYWIWVLSPMNLKPFMMLTWCIFSALMLNAY